MKTQHIALNPFTLDAKAHSKSFALVCPEPTLTVQSDAQQSDINYIVNQFINTGELPYGLAVPEYADYSDIPNDYQAALNFVNDANNTFMEYPANIRAEFDNDPAKFLDFVRDPANRERAISFGFIDSSSTDGLPIPENGTSPDNGTGA